MYRRLWVLLVSLALTTSGLIAAGAVIAPVGGVAQAATTAGPLHTTGADGIIYDSANQPVRLVGFNWNGTENGGRSDYQKTADVCGVTWRTPADAINNLPFNYDNFYQVIRDWGYNVIRVPISWNNLEPVAPVWSASTSQYVHTWNQTYLNDLKSMVTKARANGLMVILDMHQDYWSPALHHITNWNGTQGYCEGVGMPRWLDPTIDAKASTTQNTDFFNAMNQFYRNVRDPASTLTNASPWQLLYSAWDQLAYQFSPQSGFADASAVVGADILNEPYFSYVGGNPPAGQTVLQASGARLVAFYNALAPAITNRNSSWLLFFQDSTGGYNTANPANRESPTISAKPTVPGNWVYSFHDYNFSYGTFSDGVARHDDFGITLANADLANANAMHVPLYVGEFTNFTLGVDARQLTAADMAQTKLFLSWAKQNHVNWTFWAYVNPYRPMTVIDYTTNQAIMVVKQALDTGLDTQTANLPPVASFTSSCTLLVCSFNGTGSSDPDGSVVSYAWTFGDGGTSTASSPGHTYATAG
ncbi:MAG: cellulase family glycosylhydrolase, partial [Mycobacterium sp.]